MPKKLSADPQPVPMQLPFGGIDEQNSFTLGPKGVTPSAQNVWPNDSVTGRDRISRRPGLERALSSRLRTGSVQNISVSQVALDEVAGTGDCISIVGASATDKPRVYQYADGATAYTAGTAMVSSQTLGCTDEDNNFYVAAVTTSSIQVLKVSTTYSESWNVTVVGPSSANLVGIAAFGGTVYVYVMPASGSATSTHGIYRFNASTGAQRDVGPWLTSSGNSLVTVTGLSKAYQHIAITHGVLGVVGSDGTDLVLQQIDLATGVVARTTAVQAPLAHYPVKLCVDGGANFYVLTEAANAAANIIYKIDGSGTIVSGWPYTPGGTVRDMCYDPISYCLAIVGTGLGGGTDSMRLIDATNGTLTAGGQPQDGAGNAITDWYAVAADGIQIVSGNETVGTFRLRRSVASGNDLVRVVAPTVATANPVPIWQKATGSTVSVTLWIVCSGLLVTPTTSPMQSNRITRSAAVVAGSLYSFSLEDDTSTLITNAFTSPAAPVVWSALAASPPTTTDQPTSAIGRSFYFCDGSEYRTWNLSTNQVGTLVASANELPSDPNGNKCTIVEAWRGRLILFGLGADPQNAFACAQDDTTDWDYFREVYDPRQAWALANSPCGRCPDRIMGFVPYTNDTAIVLGNRSIWQLSGDPASGGRWDMISDITGGAWGRAWCTDPSGVIYFFGSQGSVWQMVPNQPPRRISGMIDTTRLYGLNLNEIIVQMAWDNRFKGIRIFISPIAKGAATHFWWEQEQNSWWPFVHANENHNPMAVCVADGDRSGERKLLIGTRDGFIATYGDTAQGDIGSKIDAWVDMPPIVAGGNLVYLDDLQVTMSKDSGPAEYTVRGAEAIEAAYNAEAQETGTLADGRNTSQAFRVSGHAIYVRLQSNEIATPWAVEQMTAVVRVKQGLVARRRFA